MEAGPCRAATPATLLELLDDFKARGIKFRSLRDGIVTDPASEVGGAMAQAMVTIISAFAQLERDQLSERTKAGMAVAAANGRRAGRREVTTEHEKVKRAHELKAHGLKPDGHWKDYQCRLGHGLPVPRPWTPEAANQNCPGSCLCDCCSTAEDSGQHPGRKYYVEAGCYRRLIAKRRPVDHFWGKAGREMPCTSGCALPQRHLLASRSSSKCRNCWI